jgi:hypothetical protein
MADNGPTVRDHLQLLGKFLRHPRTVGAVAPSSAALAREMVTGVGESEAERFVELAPRPLARRRRRRRVCRGHPPTVAGRGMRLRLG